MKKARKTIKNITGLGFGLGGGSMAIGAMGGTAANNAALGLGNMSAALPAMGHIGGAGMLLGSMKGLGNTMKRKKGFRI